MILQVIEWEINIEKDKLAATIFNYQIKFCHAYMSSLLAEANYTSTITSCINARALEVAKLITEQELLNDGTL